MTRAGASLGFLLFAASCADAHQPCIAAPLPGTPAACVGTYGRPLCLGACECDGLCFPATSTAGVCLGSVSTDEAFSRAQPCLHGRVLGFTSIPGFCLAPDVCAELAALGSPDRCVYADGSPFVDGTISCDCAEADGTGLVCGPGCSECPEGSNCWGVSELSNLGLCIEESMPTFADIQPCGAPGETCPGGHSCVRFANPPAEELTSRGLDVPGACVESDRCRRVAATFPARFRCEEL